MLKSKLKKLQNVEFKFTQSSRCEWHTHWLGIKNSCERGPTNR